MTEYPTEQELKKIEEWDGKDIESFLAFIESLWHWPTYFVRRGKKVIRLELHTGGWSGNEAIISALGNAWGNMFWLSFWEKSIRGGHYWFKIPLSFWKTERTDE